MDHPPGQTAPPTRRRPRLIIALRTAMLAVLIAGGFLGWQARRASIQRQAAARIIAAGGKVVYDDQPPPMGTCIAPNKSPAPAWLSRLAGDELFHEIVEVDLKGNHPPMAALDDATIAALLTCDQLATLNLSFYRLTDDQLGRLAGLDRLRSLSLDGCDVTGPDIRQFRELTKLEDLALWNMPAAACRAAVGLVELNPNLKHLTVDGPGALAVRDLAPLANLASLEVLTLNPSPADEACLQFVANATGLYSLNLAETAITDDGFRRLGALGRLNQIQLEGSRVTDDGLATCERWPDLAELTLHDGHVATRFGRRAAGQMTDVGLGRLAHCQLLTTIKLPGRRFTDAGLDTLATLPFLETLDLGGVEATEAGLRRLLANHQLVELGLRGPGVTDTWAALLGTQARLERLKMSGSNVTDGVVPDLLCLPTLLQLDLAGSRLTDEGLAQLARSTVPRETLDVRNTRVTEAGLAAFREARPSCRVLADPSGR